MVFKTDYLDLGGLLTNFGFYHWECLVSKVK
jgi:hypothetical protein